MPKAGPSTLDKPAPYHNRQQRQALQRLSTANISNALRLTFDSPNLECNQQASMVHTTFRRNVPFAEQEGNMPIFGSAPPTSISGSLQFPESIKYRAPHAVQCNYPATDTLISPMQTPPLIVDDAASDDGTQVAVVHAGYTGVGGQGQGRRWNHGTNSALWGAVATKPHQRYESDSPHTPTATPSHLLPFTTAFPTNSSYSYSAYSQIQPSRALAHPHWQCYWNGMACDAHDENGKSGNDLPMAVDLAYSPVAQEGDADASPQSPSCPITPTGIASLTGTVMAKRSSPSVSHFDFSPCIIDESMLYAERHQPQQFQHHDRRRQRVHPYSCARAPHASSTLASSPPSSKPEFNPNLTNRVAVTPTKLHQPQPIRPIPLIHLPELTLRAHLNADA